jgi:hypothetical protein
VPESINVQFEVVEPESTNSNIELPGKIIIFSATYKGF